MFPSEVDKESHNDSILGLLASQSSLIRFHLELYLFDLLVDFMIIRAYSSGFFPRYNLNITKIS